MFFRKAFQSTVKSSQRLRFLRRTLSDNLKQKLLSTCRNSSALITPVSSLANRENA